MPNYASYIKQPMDFLRKWADVNGRVRVGTLDYRVCFTSGARLCELHQAADGLLHNDNDRGGVGTLDYRGGVGTLDYMGRGGNIGL